MEESRLPDDDTEFVSGLHQGLRRLADSLGTETNVFDPALESIVAVETAIFDGSSEPRVRGYAVADLARRSAYMEMAYLLLRGELPTLEFLADFQSVLCDVAELPPAICALMTALPLNAPPSEVLRTAITALAHFDSQPGEDDSEAILSQTQRLLARLPMALAVRRAAWGTGPTTEIDPDLGYAANLLWLLTGNEPSDTAEAAFEVALVVLAEQGLDAATLAARAAVSTGGDLFAAVTAAVTVASGPLHAGPSDEICHLLARIGPDVGRLVVQVAEQGHMFAGFDPRVPPGGDPRVKVLSAECQSLADALDLNAEEQIARQLEIEIAKHMGHGPTIDWPLSRLFKYLGIDGELFRPLANIARLPGWAAHASEQLQRNQLLRPRARYVGPRPRGFLPLEGRG